MATAAFSKFADRLSTALSQHHHVGCEIAQQESFSFSMSEKKAFFCPSFYFNLFFNKTNILFITLLTLQYCIDFAIYQNESATGKLYFGWV